MAKLVDALALGASGVIPMEVQVLFPALWTGAKYICAYSSVVAAPCAISSGIIVHVK